MGFKLISFYEDFWFIRNADYELYNHLTIAFGGESTQMISSWSEAVVPNGYDIVCVIESGKEELSNFVHPTNVVYVFGRTGMADSTLISNVNPTLTLRIDTPNSNCLWGSQTAAIILRDRQLKGE